MIETATLETPHATALRTLGHAHASESLMRAPFTAGGQSGFFVNLVVELKKRIQRLDSRKFRYAIGPYLGKHF